MKKKKCVETFRNGKKTELDVATLRWVARDLMAAHKFLIKGQRNFVRSYICPYGWASHYRALAGGRT